MRTHTPPTLREALQDLREKVNVRVFLLRYLQSIPAAERPTDCDAFETRLENEWQYLEEMAGVVVTAWEEGRLSILQASQILRMTYGGALK